MVKGVLFDFFGTLVNYNPDRTSQTYEATFEVLTSLGVRQDYQFFLSTSDNLFDRFMAESEATQTEFSMQQVFQVLMDLLEVPVKQSELDLLSESYTIEWAKSVEPIPGVKRFLSNLSQQFRLGLITNTHYTPMIYRLLGEMDIEELFEIVFTSVDHGKSKPHPAIFSDALTRMDISAADVVYVGDSYQADYKGATAIGINCYLIGKHARVPVEYQIPTVLDLPLHRLK
ncbi:MAG: HAD family hydrolase [bacterium]